MKLGEYKVLDKETVKQEFMDYIGSIKLPIIDYIAIGVQDRLHKTSTSLMSRPEWQKTFQEQGLAKYDPIRRTAFLTKSSIFTFDSVDFGDSMGHAVMQLRKKHDIENGIVLVRREHYFNYMFTLATGYKNFNTHKFISDNYQHLQRICFDLSNLVNPSTKEYQPMLSQHPIADAK